MAQRQGVMGSWVEASGAGSAHPSVLVLPVDEQWADYMADLGLVCAMCVNLYIHQCAKGKLIMRLRSLTSHSGICADSQSSGQGM